VANTKLIAMTGTSGLIGKTFIEMLASDIEIVHKISSSKIKISEIADQIKWAAASGAKYFLHLGWPASSSNDNYRISQKNFDALEKTLFIKNVCEKFDIFFIGIGSPLDRFIYTDNIYSLTKYVAKQVFLKDILEGRITWLRPFYIFDQISWPKFMYDTDKEIVEIEDNSPRDYIHIKDVTRGIESVIRWDISGEVDLGSQIFKTPSELCTALGKSFSFKPNISQKEELELYTAATNEKLSKVWNARDTKKIFKGVK
jgi:nucleoside-diphosphate-sugar epimerase